MDQIKIYAATPLNETHQCTGLFKMIVGVIHNTLQMQPHVIYFLWGYVKDQVYVPPLPASILNWKYKSEPPLKPSPLTCGTKSIIVLMFVESLRVNM